MAVERDPGLHSTPVAGNRQRLADKSDSPRGLVKKTLQRLLLVRKGLRCTRHSEATAWGTKAGSDGHTVRDGL